MPDRSRIQLLPDEKFWEAYLPLSRIIQNASKELHDEVYGELNRLDDTLQAALDARWGKTDAYYEIAEDWNVCWHTSMAVCSDEMCCGEFLEIVQKELGSMEHDWCFHVAL